MKFEIGDIVFSKPKFGVWNSSSDWWLELIVDINKFRNITVLYLDSSNKNLINQKICFDLQSYGLVDSDLEYTLVE